MSICFGSQQTPPCNELRCINNSPKIVAFFSIFTSEINNLICSLAKPHQVENNHMVTISTSEKGHYITREKKQYILHKVRKTILINAFGMHTATDRGSDRSHSRMNSRPHLEDRPSGEMLFYTLLFTFNTEGRTRLSITVLGHYVV